MCELQKVDHGQLILLIHSRFIFHIRSYVKRTLCLVSKNKYVHRFVFSIKGENKSFLSLSLSLALSSISRASVFLLSSVCSCLFLNIFSLHIFVLIHIIMCLVLIWTLSWFCSMEMGYSNDGWRDENSIWISKQLIYFPMHCAILCCSFRCVFCVLWIFWTFVRLKIFWACDLEGSECFSIFVSLNGTSMDGNNGNVRVEN